MVAYYIHGGIVSVVRRQVLMIGAVGQRMLSDVQSQLQCTIDDMYDEQGMMMLE